MYADDDDTASAAMAAVMITPDIAETLVQILEKVNSPDCYYSEIDNAGWDL